MKNNQLILLSILFLTISLKSYGQDFSKQVTDFIEVQDSIVAITNVTLNKAIQRFRRVVKYAISEDYLSKDPFILYKAKRVKKEVIFLSPGQLKKLEEEFIFEYYNCQLSHFQ